MIDEAGNKIKSSAVACLACPYIAYCGGRKVEISNKLLSMINTGLLADAVKVINLFGCPAPANALFIFVKFAFRLAADAAASGTGL
ncbi:hypothetical protein D3C86_1707270 [compost metagenome]